VSELVLLEALYMRDHADLAVAADRIGIYNTNIISSIVITAMFWVWLACKTATSCIVLVVIIGVAGGAYVSLQAPTSTKTATDMRYGGTMVGQALCTWR
jgi:hypothetical protein